MNDNGNITPQAITAMPRRLPFVKIAYCVVVCWHLCIAWCNHMCISCRLYVVTAYLHFYSLGQPSRFRFLVYKGHTDTFLMHCFISEILTCTNSIRDTLALGICYILLHVASLSLVRALCRHRHAQLAPLHPLCCTFTSLYSLNQYTGSIIHV